MSAPTILDLCCCAGAASEGYRRAGPYVAAYGAGGGKATVPEMQEAMDIHWTTVRSELTEAIPPAYTEFIGRALMTHLEGA